MSDQTPRKRRWYREPLNLGVDWLEQRPSAYAAYLRVAPVIAGVAFVTALAAVVGVGLVLFQRSADQAALIRSNQTNAVTNCQNANESRKASLALWNFIFDASSPSKTAEQAADLAAVREWIGKLYAPRDCNDLSRKYPIPPPPTIGPH